MIKIQVLSDMERLLQRAITIAAIIRIQGQRIIQLFPFPTMSNVALLMNCSSIWMVTEVDVELSNCRAIGARRR
jgi:hypothetical protein